MKPLKRISAQLAEWTPSLPVFLMPRGERALKSGLTLLALVVVLLAGLSVYWSDEPDVFDVQNVVQMKPQLLKKVNYKTSYKIITKI